MGDGKRLFRNRDILGIKEFLEKLLNASEGVERIEFACANLTRALQSHGQMLAVIQDRLRSLSGLHESLDKVSQGISELRTATENQSLLLEGIKSTFSEYAALTRELYNQEILAPLARMLLSLKNDIVRAIKGSSTGNVSFGVLYGLSTQLDQILQFLGFELMNVNVGQRYDPSCMKAVGTKESSDPGKVGLVAEVLQQGLVKGNWKEEARVVVYVSNKRQAR